VRVLVTGSAGFVGRRLIQALVRAGHQALGIDRRAGSDRWSVRADVRDWRGDREGPFDVCVHLASDVGGFLHNATATELVTYEAELLQAVTRLCGAHGCARVIYTSSIAVFETSGDFTAGPVTTGDQRTPYALAKTAGERLVARAFDDFAIVRPTNIFGAGQPAAGDVPGESHVIPDLLRKLRSPAPFELLGDGTQTRNFIHVDDVVAFLLTVLTSGARGWFNLRSDIALSIDALAAALMRATGRRREVRHRPEFMAYEPAPIRAFDLSPALALGWRPRVSELVAGLGELSGVDGRELDRRPRRASTVVARADRAPTP